MIQKSIFSFKSYLKPAKLLRKRNKLKTSKNQYFIIMFKSLNMSLSKPKKKHVSA